MQNTDMKIGNIFVSPIMDILNDGDQNGWLTFSWDKECHDCNFLPMCHSGCIFRKRSEGREKLCSIDKVTHKRLVRLLYDEYERCASR